LHHRLTVKPVADVQSIHPRGNVKQKVDPFPNSLSTQILPP
jgi:hypothetical protein